ncbi:MAG: hypothetical protein QJR00_01030 [Bacillota bacterium]|nr:hypothetical protein [Bacillota bacterium]
MGELLLLVGLWLLWHWARPARKGRLTLHLDLALAPPDLWEAFIWEILWASQDWPQLELWVWLGEAGDPRLAELLPRRFPGVLFQKGGPSGEGLWLRPQRDEDFSSWRRHLRRQLRAWYRRPGEGTFSLAGEGREA